MIFSSVEGKKTRMGRSLKEFFFPDCEQKAKDCGVFRPENRVWFLSVRRKKKHRAKSLKAFIFWVNEEVACFFARDFNKWIQVRVGMEDTVFWCILRT